MRRRVPWVADPEPIEAIETEQVPGMTAAEVELLAEYLYAHRTVL